MEFKLEKTLSRQKVLLPFLIFVMAGVVFTLYGFHRRLLRDDAIFLYSGQRMAEGVPPYVSIFDHKGPLAYMLTGLGAILSKQLGWDDIYTVRLVFFILSCFTVVAVYFLCRSIFQSPSAGVFGALSFLGFFPFARSAASGPQSKTPMVLFETLSLVLISQRKWFWAGVCGSLAFLTWQPMVILPLVTLVLAVVESRQERLGAIVRTLAGVGLPVVIIIAYFQYHGALYELFEGAVLFNIFYIERIEYSLLSHFLRPLISVLAPHGTMFVPILIGLLMVGYLYIWRRAHHGSFQDTLTKDIFAPVLLSFPLAVLWSFLDFQTDTDFYVFLPYIALGFGKFLDIAVDHVSGGIGPRLFGIGLGIVLIISAVVPGIMHQGRIRLEEQRQGAFKIERRFGMNARIVSIGVPEVLVLLHRVNRDRYVFIRTGVDRLIEATNPGGFRLWLRGLKHYNPEVVVFGTTRGIYTERLMQWLGVRYRAIVIGHWNVYVRK